MTTALKQGLSLGLSQGLVLTPQLQQSIRLLQLSSLELESEVQAMLDSNPFLQRDEGLSERELFDFSNVTGQLSQDSGQQDGLLQDSEAASDFDTPDIGSDGEPDWGGDGSVEIDPNHSEWGADAPAGNPGQTDHNDDVFNRVQRDGGLPEYLREQAQHVRLSSLDAWALQYLIDALDDDGFLTDSLADLAAALPLADAPEQAEQRDAILDSFRVAQRLLQSMEPVGVGAENWLQALQWQLQAAPVDAVQKTALLLLQQPLALLAQKNFKKLAQNCGCAENLVQQAVQRIAQLNPKPAAAFQNADTAAVIPDVFVQAQGRGYRVVLNTDVMPRLKVDDITAQLLKMHKARQAKAAQGVNVKDDPLQQCLLEAKGFIKSISQRFETVQRVANAIVARQHPFLRHGALAMRPLVLRDIADELGLHESTVSRVTTAKYMATPQGVFEFKYFFDASLATDTGGQTSGTAVRALIEQMIAAESKSKPLSDNAIADLLEQQGITCARRTVAKYREALRIAPVSLRKVRN